MHRSGKQPRILVVEDDGDIRHILCVYLKYSNFEVRDTSDGQEAIDLIQEFCPHLIVLDLMMQPVSGWDVLRWLRANRLIVPAESGTESGSHTAEASLHTIPVLVLTALTQIAQQIDGFEAGAVEYMTKPTQPSKIVERIRALLLLSVEQQAMLRRKRIEDQRAVLERIRAPQPDEFFY